MAQEFITVATEHNQFFRINQTIYERLNTDFNDGQNIDLSSYSQLFTMTRAMGFSIEETLESALVTNTTNNSDVGALADYLLTPRSSRQIRYDQTVQCLIASNETNPKHNKHESLDDVPKKMKDIVFAYIRQLQRMLPQHHPFYTIPTEVQKIVLEFYSKRFEYKHDFDENGIVYWLGCNYGISSQWINPALRGVIEVTASSLMADSEALHSIVGRDAVRCVTKPVPDQWIMVEFMDIAVIPTYYSLRHYTTWDGEALRNWRFEAGNNNTDCDTDEWQCLIWHVNDDKLRKRGATYTWRIPPDSNLKQKSFSQFRLYQHDKNSNFHDYLALSGFEIYGTITARKDIVNTRGQIAGVEPKRYVRARGFRRNFAYVSDFDKNGLLYFMGVVGGSSSSYQNPSAIGVVEVSSSGMMNTDESLLDAFVGRKTLHCRTKWSAKPWMSVDLKGVKTKLTHYTLRHYAAFDTEALRYWNLEGSNDGKRWIIIQQHLNDQALDYAGRTHTWDVDADQYFTHFRIFMFDRNSNNHYYLACSGIELYGNAFGGIVSEHYDVDIIQIKENEEEIDNWTCEVCTFVNACDRVCCEMCDAPEPTEVIDINAQYEWNPLKRSDQLQISENGCTVTNLANDHIFRTIISKMVFQHGRHSFEIHIVNHTQDTNFIVGLVPKDFNPIKNNKQYVGWQCSWGYVANTGAKSHQGKETPKYGAKFRRNDKIKCTLDLDKHTLEFCKNGKSQGIAFSNLNCMVSPAVTLIGKDASVKIVN